jgi:hypothetical protein
MRVLNMSANRGSLRVGLDAVLLGSYSAESLRSSGTACLLLPTMHGVSHGYAIGQPLQPSNMHRRHAVHYGR